MPLEIGEKLGRYEIRTVLGAGGMGEVYQATDTKLGRDVALKILPEELTEHPEKLARFEREARLLAALNHPGIATLHGLENHEGKPFLVMELSPGRDPGRADSPRAAPGERSDGARPADRGGARSRARARRHPP